MVQYQWLLLSYYFLFLNLLGSKLLVSQSMLSSSIMDKVYDVYVKIGHQQYSVFIEQYLCLLTEQ